MARPGLEPGTPRLSGSRGSPASATTNVHIAILAPGEVVRHAFGWAWFRAGLGLCGRLEVSTNRQARVAMTAELAMSGVACGLPRRHRLPQRWPTRRAWPWRTCLASSRPSPTAVVVAVLERAGPSTDTVTAWSRMTGYVSARRSAPQRSRTRGTARTTRRPQCDGRSSRRPARECSTSAPGPAS
jgi:hypothetical protein